MNQELIPDFASFRSTIYYIARTTALGDRDLKNREAEKTETAPQTIRFSHLGVRLSRRVQCSFSWRVKQSPDK